MPRSERSPSINRVLLRDVREEDLRAFFEHQRDPDANRMAAFPSRDKEAFTAHWTKILGDSSVIIKTVLFDGAVAGNIGSWEQSGRRKVGYWIGKEFWGKGVAGKSLFEFLGHVKARPLYAHVAKQNVASICVLEKCGFTIAGEDKAPSEAGGEVVEEFIFILS